VNGSYVAATACVCAYGVGVDALWNGMMSGRSALSSPPWANGTATVVGTFEGLGQSQSTRCEALALAVAQMIAAQEALSGPVGVVVGNGTANDHFDDGDEPGRIADAIGAHGPVAGVRSDCATGIASLELAQAWLDLRACESVLVVGTSSYADQVSMQLLSMSGALGSRSAGLPAPFGRQRRGTAVGEGAAALLLKRTSSSGLGPRVLGTGLTLNSHRLVAPPTSCAALARAIRKALKTSGIDPSMIAAIIAHGTGTELNDEHEVRAIRDVFGADAQRVPITSIKRWLGHTFEASALFSVIAAMQALKTRTLPGCGTAILDPEFEDLSIADSHVELGQERFMLVLAHGMGVINGVAVVGDSRPVKRAASS